MEAVWVSAAIVALAEIGDKTQIATSLLAARFQDIAFVTFGSTMGMMLANVPAVYFGEAVIKIFPLAYVRITAAIMFALIALWVVYNALYGFQAKPTV